MVISTGGYSRVGRVGVGVWLGLAVRAGVEIN